MIAPILYPVMLNLHVTKEKGPVREVEEMKVKSTHRAEMLKRRVYALNNILKKTQEKCTLKMIMRSSSTRFLQRTFRIFCFMNEIPICVMLSEIWRKM